MIAALIFTVSFLTLLQFFVSYSHSLVAASLEQELSEQAREICGFSAKTARGDQFDRLLRLIALCPECRENHFEVQAVVLYFRMLSLASLLLRRALPSVARWVDAERGGCAYAAAVALDRRIAHNRMMLIQQSSQ